MNTKEDIIAEEFSNELVMAKELARIVLSDSVTKSGLCMAVLLPVLIQYLIHNVADNLEKEDFKNFAGALKLSLENLLDEYQ